MAAPFPRSRRILPEQGKVRQARPGVALEAGQHAFWQRSGGRDRQSTVNLERRNA
jgi:hypothetical protein